MREEAPPGFAFKENPRSQFYEMENRPGGRQRLPRGSRASPLENAARLPSAEERGARTLSLPAPEASHQGSIRMNAGRPAAALRIIRNLPPQGKRRARRGANILFLSDEFLRATRYSLT